MSVFGSHFAVEEVSSGDGLHFYRLNYEDNAPRLQPLVDSIVDVLPEYAFGFQEGQSLHISEAARRVREAARSVFGKYDYENRGEIGEMVLHMLLRDFHESVPLVSKIYFKDSDGVPPLGFDGVHVTNADEPVLWLGESKFYKTGSSGVDELVEDVKKRIDADFLRREFMLIKKKIPSGWPEVERWREFLTDRQSLREIFKTVIMPCVCTYGTHVFNGHTDATDAFIAEFAGECNGLHQRFREKVPDTKLKVLLLLLPVPCKQELEREVGDRIKRFGS